ncbi:MAG: Do family serine endopeptidase [Pirellulales bacterium]|nr:Do family serine endopeptidase [Pirellulales bacterium]
MQERNPTRSQKFAVALAAVVTVASAAIATSLPSIAAPDQPRPGKLAAPPLNSSPTTRAANSANSPAQDPVAAAETNYARSLSRAFRHAAEQVLPAVVMIQTTPHEEHVSRGSDQSNEAERPAQGDNPSSERFRQQHPELAPFFRQQPEHPQPHGQVGLGSGVIIDPAGVILTNNHVVAGGGRVRVRLHDGREYIATDVKTDPKTDMAIVRIEAGEHLPFARTGDSEQMQVGDWVLALGQPFGLEGTVTSGIISAKGRGIGITARENFLQTDAAINPGNSGGPLVNLDGEVIGINTAISSRTGSNSGVGFAVPMNLARWVSDQLVKTGSVRRAYLGVAIQPVSHDLAMQFGVKTREGVLVTDVFPNTPAADAGLNAGDVILHFAGHPVSEPRELQGFVEQAEIGSRQPLLVYRGKERITLQMTMREQPGDFGQVALATGEEEQPAQPKVDSAEFEQFGFEVGTLTPEVAKKLKVAVGTGVVVTNVTPGSAAAEVGIEPGMVIGEVNRTAVHSLDHFRTAVKANDNRDEVLLLVRTQGGSRFVVLKQAR